MTLEQIIYTIETGKVGSISKAAKNLLVTQPNLSMSIKHLEEELGFNIFNRNTSGVVTTVKGKEFLKYAQEIYSNINFINNMNNPSSKNIDYCLKVSSLCYPFILDQFLEFHNEYKDYNTDFSFESSNYEQVLEDISSKSFDIGLLSVCNDAIGDWNDLFKLKNVEFHPLICNSPCICILNTHPLYNKKDISLEDIYKYPYVYYHIDELSFINDRHYNSINLTNVKNKINVSDYQYLLYAMEKINAFSILTFFTDIGYSMLSNKNINFREIEIKTSKKTLGWIKNKDSLLSELSLKFIDRIDEFLNRNISLKHPIEKLNL